MRFKRFLAVNGDGRENMAKSWWQLIGLIVLCMPLLSTAVAEDSGAKPSGKSADAAAGQKADEGAPDKLESQVKSGEEAAKKGPKPSPGFGGRACQGRRPNGWCPTRITEGISSPARR
jgi:hypothetical protein